MSDLLKSIKGRVMAGEEEETLDLVSSALDQGLTASVILQEALTPAMMELGVLWNRGEVYIPEIMGAADVFQKTAGYLEPYLETGGAAKKIGTVVLGTVEGDLHNLGKNLVAVILRTGGFNVIDLGVNVPTKDFIGAAKDHHAQIIGLSALLTTTMKEQKNVIDALLEEGIRSQVKVLVGGAPISAEWAKDIGADGYGRNAGEALELAKRMIND